MSAFAEAVSFKLWHPSLQKFVTEQEFKALQSQVNVEKEIEEAEKVMREHLAKASLEATQKSSQGPVEHSAQGWIHKFIEETNGVTLRKLVTKMQERDFSQSKINRQLELVEKDYEFDGENIIGLKPNVKIQREDNMAKKKVAKKSGKAGKGRVNSFKDKTFVVVKKENPYRAESARGKAYEKLLKAGVNGMPYSKELEEGNCLRDALTKGFVKIKA